MEANNIAAMREALEFVHDKLLTWNYTDKATAKMAVAVVDRCSKALAKPPRQCDVGTDEEQMKRQYDTMCNTTNACPDSDWSCRKCFAQWAQSPYSESNGVK